MGRSYRGSSLRFAQNGVKIARRIQQLVFWMWDSIGAENVLGKTRMHTKIKIKTGTSGDRRAYE
jgi:hypothetical protein